MGKFTPADSGYVEVKYRIEKFYGTHPEGAIRTNIFSMEENLVVVGAEVFRHRDDDNPIGTGFSMMNIPGGTPYTKGSELENAETSAVGRAIAMAGFEVHVSVASADEIDMKSGEDTRPTAKAAALSTLRQEVRAMAVADYGAGWKGVLLGMGLSVTNKDTEEDLIAARSKLALRRTDMSLPEEADEDGDVEAALEEITF